MEDFDDPEAEYEMEAVQEHYEAAVRAEYGIEKDGGEYDF